MPRVVFVWRVNSGAETDPSNHFGQVAMDGIELDKAIKRIWMETLEISTVVGGDFFLDLGGNSLQAMIIFGRIKDELNIDIELRQIFEMSLDQIVKEIINP